MYVPVCAVSSLLLSVYLTRYIFWQLMLRASSVFSVPSVVSRNMTVEFSSRTGEGFLTRTNRTQALMELSPRWTHTTRAGLLPQWTACPLFYFTQPFFCLPQSRPPWRTVLSKVSCQMTRPNDFCFWCFTAANRAAQKKNRNCIYLLLFLVSLVYQQMDKKPFRVTALQCYR